MTEELINRRESLRSELETLNTAWVEIHKNYKEILNKIINKYMGGTWRVAHVSEDNLRIEFETEEFWRGTDKHIWQDLDIYYDPKHRDYSFKNGGYSETTRYRFELNTCCFGSFNIEGTNKVKTYYSGVAVILNNEEFQKELKEALAKVSDELRANKKQQWELEREIREINDIEKEEENAKDRLGLSIVQKSKMDETPEGYALVSWDNDGKFTKGVHYIYNKHDVTWFDTTVYASKYEAQYENRRRNAGEGYRVVAVKKMKLVA